VAEIGQMVGRVFVLWGYGESGQRVSNALVSEMTKEYQHQELAVRVAMIAADALLKRKLSRSMIGCIGIMVNKPLRQLSIQLLSLINNNGEFDAKSLRLEELQSERFLEKFMKACFDKDIASAVDLYWD